MERMNRGVETFAVDKAFRGEQSKALAGADHGFLANLHHSEHLLGRWQGAYKPPREIR